MSMPMPKFKLSKRISDNQKISPEELQAFMDHHGISIKELSEILGVSFQAVRLWLTGERSISVTNSRLVLLFKKYPKLIKEF